jgi:uncharacterized protein (TIGR00255 family)
MRSMTGFGRGRGEIGGRRMVVEIRSVNHRFLELKVRLPWVAPALEQLLSQAVRKRFDRGAISLSIRDEGGAEGASRVTADIGLAKAYAQALGQVATACGLDERPSLALIVSQPGVLQAGQEALDGEVMWGALAPAVEQALDELVASRTREGHALRADLGLRLEALRRITAEVRGLAAEAPGEARRRLEERLRRLLQPGEVDPQRLAQEVALIADRADVTEELTRLAAHLDEVERLISAVEPSGRRLDFLAQELHREINTIGSKTQRAEIAGRVLEAKAEIERLREQVQNVE